MAPLILVLIGALAVFWYLGLLTPERARIIAGVGLGLVGLLITLRGAPLAGVPLIALGGYIGWWMQRAREPKTMTRREAERLLGVRAGATEREIRDAYRLAMSTAHPDRGGSSEESSRLNEARDLLLRSPPRPSPPGDESR